MPRQDHPYTATFTSTAKVINPTESDRFIAKASLAPLRGLLPAGVNPEDNPDLLYIAADGAVAGLCNLNDDAISAETALAVHRTCVAKYISLDHDRAQVCGVVLYPGLSRFGSSEPLTDEEAATLQEPFNMSFAGVLWRVINPQLARFIRHDGGSTSGDCLSVSWEITFSSWSIGVGSRNLFDAKTVNPGDPEFDVLAKCLRVAGGSGKSPDGQPVFRIITGDAIILGYSIVPNPAANVKGILPITEGAATSSATVDTPPPVAETPAAETPASAAVEPTAEQPSTASVSITSANASEPVAPVPSEDLSVTHPETRVTTPTAPMKIESLAHLKTAWPDLQKQDATVSLASVEAFVASMEKANTEYVAKLADSENLSKNLEQSKAAAEAKAAELQASLANVQAQVEALRQAALASEQNAKFQERMADLDETFDLDDEDRSLLASEVKSLADDASFAAFKKKQEKLMCGKKKGAAKASTTTVSTASTTVTTDTVVAAFASVTQTPGQTAVPPGQLDTAAVNEMEAAFGSTMRVNGKTVAERKAEKLAAAPKE